MHGLAMYHAPTHQPTTCLPTICSHICLLSSWQSTTCLLMICLWTCRHTWCQRSKYKPTIIIIVVATGTFTLDVGQGQGARTKCTYWIYYNWWILLLNGIYHTYWVMVHSIYNLAYVVKWDETYWVFMTSEIPVL